MKKTGIIKSVAVIVAFTLFALSRTSVLEGNIAAISISAALMAGVLIAFMAQAFMNISKASKSDNNHSNH